MKKIVNLTFKKQISICIAVFIMDIVLAHLFQTGLFHNLTWLIYGVLFFINPVWPEEWVNVYPEQREKGVRIAGAICIIIGLITKFGI